VLDPIGKVRLGRLRGGSRGEKKSELNGLEVPCASEDRREAHPLTSKWKPYYPNLFGKVNIILQVDMGFFISGSVTHLPFALDAFPPKGCLSTAWDTSTRYPVRYFTYIHTSSESAEKSTRSVIWFGLVQYSNTVAHSKVFWSYLIYLTFYCQEGLPKLSYITKQ